MADKMGFQKKLVEILEMAKERQMRLSAAAVEGFFAGDGLSKEQIELVYDYLLSQKVVVKGYIKQGGETSIKDVAENEVLSPEEERYLAEYLADARFEPRSEEDRGLLLRQACAGDVLAKSRLVELYMPDLTDIARQIYRPGVSLEDLIQEGVISLMLALDSLSTAAEAEQEILTEITQGMQAYIEEHIDVKRRDEHLVRKVGDLDGRIHELNEELGRKVTVEELSLYTGMSEEEVVDILKLTDEAGNE